MLQIRHGEQRIERDHGEVQIAGNAHYLNFEPVLFEAAPRLGSVCALLPKIRGEGACAQAIGAGVTSNILTYVLAAPSRQKKASRETC